MRKNICIIDDSLPVGEYTDFISQTGLIDESALKFLCSNHQEWPEEPLKSLINEIIKSHSDWGISAFHNPSFYFNHVEEEIYSPEIIIFDWDYAAESVATEEHLLQILSTTYSVVGIFTGADKKEEILNIIKEERFKSYSNRVHLVEKGEDNAITKIIEKGNSKFESHFSFKFGQELKYNSVKSLDDILVNISNLSYDEFICAFGHRREDEKTEISLKEFVEIISEKFKNYLTNIEFTEKEIKPVDCTDINVEDISKLWSYRMYYSPTDDLVRTGDIVSMDGMDENIKYLVISANCHLQQFWKKNFGNLALIPLYEKSNDNSALKNKLNLYSSLGKFNNSNATSISNKWENEALTIISSLPVNIEGNIVYKNYVAFPKEIITINIPPPLEQNEKNLGEIRKMTLYYEYAKNIIADKRVNLNEPFQTPLIQFVLNNITGYGSPDYPHSLQELIKSIKLE